MIIEPTPRGLLKILFRHRKKFAVVFLPIFSFATLYCFVLAYPRYESDAALLVKFADSQSAQSSGQPTTGIAAAQLERIQIVNSQIGLMQSQDLLTEVLNQVGINKVYPELIGLDDQKLKINTALANLSRDLDIEPAKNANIINLALLNRNADTSAVFLNRLIDRFVNKQWSIYQNSQLPFMQQQLDQARVKLEQSRKAVEQYKLTNGIMSLEEERTLLLKQASDAQESLTQAISKQEEAQGRFLKLEEMLKTMPADTKLSDENDRFKPVDDARSRVDDLLARQKQMSDNYLANSTTMKTLADQLAFAQQQLAGASRQSAARVRMGANPVRQQTEIELAQAAGDQYGATASRGSFENALQQIRTKLSTLESQSQQLDALTLQQQVDEENFRNYLQAVNDASVSDDLNRQRITSIAVIQTPTVAIDPSRPRTRLVIPGAFLFALALGFAVVIMAEMFDERFSAPEQIETVLGLPVLGTFTHRRLPPSRPLLAYGKALPAILVFLLLASAAFSSARAADQLDPAWGHSFVVRDQSGRVVESLYPEINQFIRQGPTGNNLGWAKRMGSSLAFFNRDGRQVLTARRELLPANFPMNAIAVVRDPSGNAIGVIARR
jgi:uncharacterized protein involved in exopolysaccharide biosynthesis